MARIIAAGLLVLLGTARGTGGVILALRGPAAVDSDLMGPLVGKLLGLGLVMVSVLALVAAYGVIRKRSWAVATALVAPLVFVADGALNGYLLWGRPGAGGTVVNAIVAAFICGLVLSARRRGDFCRRA